MFYQQHPVRRSIIVGLAPIIILVAMLAMVFFMLMRYFDRPVLYYSVNEAGQEVCLEVIDKGVSKKCSAFTVGQRENFEWIQKFPDFNQK